MGAAMGGAMLDQAAFIHRRVPAWFAIIRTRVSTWPAITLVTLGLIAGCNASKPSAGGDKGTTGGAAADVLGGACDRREREHLCSEYRGKQARPDWVERECGAMRAPFLAGGCPAAGSVGRCTRGAGTASRTDTLFYPPMTRETVVAMCSDGVVGDP